MTTSIIYPSLLVSCQQTRFDVVEDNASKEVDIKDLNITIPLQIPTEVGGIARKPKGKSKAAVDGLEILTSAHLRLKTGVHYGFVGRNGTGKSSTQRWSLLYTMLMSTSCPTSDSGTTAPRYFEDNPYRGPTANGYE